MRPNRLKSRLEMFYRSLKTVPISSASLLGAPLTVQGMSAVIREKREDLERKISKLRLIVNHQVFAHLKNCFYLPKLQYIIRASQAYRRENDLKEFDGTLVTALSTDTNVQSEGESLKQAVLPVRMRVWLKSECRKTSLFLLS